LRIVGADANDACAAYELAGSNVSYQHVQRLGVIFVALALVRPPRFESEIFAINLMAYAENFVLQRIGKCRYDLKVLRKR